MNKSFHGTLTEHSPHTRIFVVAKATADVTVDVMDSTKLAR